MLSWKLHSSSPAAAMKRARPTSRPSRGVLFAAGLCTCCAMSDSVKPAKKGATIRVKWLVPSSSLAA
jgi:hypothetical protein